MSLVCFKKHYWSLFILVVIALSLAWVTSTYINMKEVKASMSWEGLTIISSKDNLAPDTAELDPLPEWQQSERLTPLYLVRMYNLSAKDEKTFWVQVDEAVARHDCAAYKNFYIYMTKGFLFFLAFPSIILMVIILGLFGLIYKRRSA